jgi:nanoRNase/pAp phosphatase (c-di-AMP/oligoRNAs hydrolase)
MDPDSFLKEVLGADKDGKHYGGGRFDKGGFQIPLNIFEGAEKELLWQLAYKTIKTKFMKRLGP